MSTCITIGCELVMQVTAPGMDQDIVVPLDEPRVGENLVVTVWGEVGIHHVTDSGLHQLESLE